MSDFDLMEPETAEELELKAVVPPAADAKPDAAWPREQMLDRLRTCD